MDRKAFVLLPVVLFLVISVSGCTSEIPFIGQICIPGFGTCGTTTELEHDVLIITSLDAVPSTVSTGQQFRLSAWIENKGGETIPQKELAQSAPVKIKLYDTCEGLFESIKVTCPGSNTEATGTECSVTNILAKQKVPVYWTLVAYGSTKIPLETSCTLRVYVQYPYRTKSISSITFIDYVEMQRQVEAGKFTPITSYITEGYGPIKPYLTAEDQQPIPVTNGVASTTTLAFQLKNKGSGFLAGPFEALGSVVPGQASTTATTTPTIPVSAVKIEESTGAGSGISNNIWSAILAMPAFQFVGKETPKQFFTIPTPSNNQIEKIATYYVSTRVDYIYEFRKEVKVTIKPPKIM